MHLNQRIVNLTTPLTHPRFFVLAKDLAHESQALFGLIIDDSEAFRRSKNERILKFQGSVCLPKAGVDPEGALSTHLQGGSLVRRNINIQRPVFY